MKKFLCFTICLSVILASSSCSVKSSEQVEKQAEAIAQKKSENVYDFQGYVNIPKNEKYAVLHSQPDEESDTVAHLRNGDIVDIFEFSGDWFLVKSGSFEGYIKADKILLEQPVTTMLTSAVTTAVSSSETETVTEPETAVVTEPETTATTAAPETTVPETTVTVPETTQAQEEAAATTAEPVVVTEIVYVEVPVTQTTTEPVQTQPYYYYEEPQTYQYNNNSSSNVWIPAINSAYVYALPSVSGYGYDYYLNVSGNYDYLYVTYVTQGLYTTDTIRFETNDILLTSGTEFSGIYAYVVPYYNGEIEGETVFSSCETPLPQDFSQY